MFVAHRAFSYQLSCQVQSPALNPRAIAVLGEESRRDDMGQDSRIRDRDGFDVPNEGLARTGSGMLRADAEESR